MTVVTVDHRIPTIADLYRMSPNILIVTEERWRKKSLIQEIAAADFIVLRSKEGAHLVKSRRYWAVGTEVLP